MHAYSGRGERVVWREEEGAPVLAAIVRGVRWASEDVVPFQDILVGRMCRYVGRRRFCDGDVFFGESLSRCRCGHDERMWRRVRVDVLGTEVVGV